VTKLKSRRSTAIAAALAAFLTVVGGVAAFASGEGGGGGGGDRPLVITAEVQRRTLIDDVTLKGTVGRVEQRQIDASTPGRVSAVHVDDGATVEAGQPILAIDGRDAVAAPGDFPFYRDLDVGSEGNDVRQLEQILAAGGYSPGAVDTSFTEETRAALAGWQVDHGYPSTAPESDETFTIALQPSGGYAVGNTGTSGVVIGQKSAPAPETATTVHAASVAKAAINAKVMGLSLQALDAEVAEGAPASFRITSTLTTHLLVNVAIEVTGTADGEDIVVPTGRIALPQDQRSVDFQITTRQDSLVEPDETITVSISPDSSYRATDAEATTTIVSDDLPEIELIGGTAVREGGRVVLDLVADQAPVRDTPITLAFGGDAIGGDDYTRIDPVVLLPAGHRSVEVSITTLADETLENDERILVSVASGAGSYAIGRAGSAVITIDRATGAAALPTLTLRSTSTHVSEGQPIPMTLSLSRAITDDLVVPIVYSGDAGLGTDYTPVPGRVIVPAGATTLPLQVPTVDDDVVEADRTLTLTVADAATYLLGEATSGTVTIESDDVPELTIVEGADRVGEGAQRTFTFVADQAPIEDLSVLYQVLGSATPGEDFSALTGVVILPAGQTSVAVPLHALRDDVSFRPTDIIVGDWPIRIGQVLVDEGESVLAGAPLLSLVDTGLTVTLRSNATDRTKLEPGQAVTVKLTGGSVEADGTISELDDTATIDKETGEQYYEGKIDVAELDAADGSGVTIQVVLDQKSDAITVPIASVLQDGEGHDVVRVIDLEGDGSVTEKKVTTGISEGSYIEISEGLDGGEIVVVQVDKPAS
jgi:multidrug efflux pump subunit AcrA (membrane-fusion protein)/peptidoglycan hydrolase-like protein with peptidoglycan-binding domain